MNSTISPPKQLVMDSLPHAVREFGVEARKSGRNWEAAFNGPIHAYADPATGARTDLFSNTAMDVDSQGTFGIGTSYTIGKLSLDANFSYTTIKGFGQSSHMQVYEGGGLYQFTPALSFIAGYQHTRFEGHHWNQGTAGLHYLLSKRTDVYVEGVYQHASGAMGDRENVAMINTLSPSSTPNQIAATVGLRHRF